MLADSELETVLKALPFPSGASELVEGALKRVMCCPICTELFSRRDQLTGHLQKCHADRLVSPRSKQVTDHRVEEGNDSLLICPHCHFAAGFRKDSLVFGTSPTTIIFDHVQACRWNLSRRTGPAHVEFSISDDVMLIGDYLRNCAEIALFTCTSEECGKSFGSAETLVQHLVLDHSSACPEDLTEKQLEPIRLAAQRLIAKRATPKTITPVVPVRATNVETAEPTDRGDEAKPPQIPERPQPKAPVQTPSHGNATLIGKDFSRTVKERELVAGFLVLPKRLSSCLSPANWVAVHLARGEVASILPLDPFNRRLKALTAWFRKSAIEPGDKVKFRLLSVDPPEIRIWTEWEKHLNYVLRCPAEDFKWKRLPIRDCLIKVFANRPGPIHYRSLYSEISKHRDLVVGSVIATLSKHRRMLFAHSGRGMWSWLKDDTRTQDGSTPRPIPSGRLVLPAISDAIWKIVAEIEEGDFVYHLLKRTRDSLSFVQICQKIAEARGIDWRELQQTGFVNAEDERLKRLDNGHFAVREWFDDPVARPIPTPPVIDDVPEKEPTATTIATLPDSLPPPLVHNGLLARVWTVVRRMLGILVRWVRRKSHG